MLETSDLGNEDGARTEVVLDAIGTVVDSYDNALAPRRRLPIDLESVVHAVPSDRNLLLGIT